MNENPSKDQNSWARTTSWLLASNIVRNLAAIAVVILLARLTNSKILGDYALALAVTTPVFAFLQFGLKGVYLTLKHGVTYKSFLLIQALSMVLAIVFSIVIAIFISPQLLLTIFLVSLIKSNDAFGELFSGPLQKYGKPNLIFWGYSSTALFGTASVAVLLSLGMNLNIALSALAVVSIAVTLSLMARKSIFLANSRVPTIQQIKLSKRSQLVLILKAGLPTGLAASVLSLVITIPQYQVAVSSGTSAVGYLAVMLYGLAIVDIFLGTLTQAWIPRAQELLHISQSDKKAFGKGIVQSIILWSALMIPAATLGVFLMSILFPPLLGKEFSMTIGIAVPLCVAIVLSPAQHFAGVGLVVKNYYFRSIIPSVLAAITATVFGFIFVMTMGLSAQGALWAIAIALAVRGSSTLFMVLNKSEHRQGNHD